MSYRAVARAFLILVAVLNWLFRKRKNKRQAVPHTDNTQGQRSPKEPPGRRYRYYKYPTEEEHRTAEQFAWRTAKNLTIWAGSAATIAAVFTYKTWVETRRQADTANLALIAVQRAYVEPVGIRFDPIKDSSGKTNYWLAYLVLQDVGVTPTRFLRAFGTHLSFECAITDDPEASLFDIPMGPQFGQRLGPQEKLTFGPMYVSNSDLTEAGPYVIDPQRQMLFWGVAEYNDVFPGTSRHITKFCYQLVANDQGISNTIGRLGVPEPIEGPDAIPCQHHNCTDEECNYDYRIIPNPDAPVSATPPKALQN